MLLSGIMEAGKPRLRLSVEIINLADVWGNFQINESRINEIHCSGTVTVLAEVDFQEVTDIDHVLYSGRWSRTEPKR